MLKKSFFKEIIKNDFLSDKVNNVFTKNTFKNEKILSNFKKFEIKDSIIFRHKGRSFEFVVSLNKLRNKQRAVSYKNINKGYTSFIFIKKDYIK